MSERPVLDVSCPACGQNGMEAFHSQHEVPTNSCLLLASRAEAQAFPTGSIQLGFCPGCGFISNLSFNASLAEYSARYEETQAFSPTFVEFARALASSWVEKYDLAGKHVIEIGCGKGEFLVMMAEAGIGSGLGIDPGVNVERIDSPLAHRLEWIADLFDERYGPLVADAVVCRQTLEHIWPVGEFVSLVRRAVGDRLRTTVLFQLPDTQRVLDEVAFWDIYYEHCSYFSSGSLARLFERSGFEILDLRLDYDGQYLILEARPLRSGQSARLWPADDVTALSNGVTTFESSFTPMIEDWKARLRELEQSGGTSVIWGAGSKGVAFLTAAGSDVHSAVDVNPNKHGTYMAGTGHPIVAPTELPGIAPDLVVAMNSIYLDEIRRDLTNLGVEAEVVAV